MVRKVIKEAMRLGRPVEIIYQGDKEITHRVVDIKEIKDDKLKAYCRNKRGIRYFNIDNILSAFIYKEDEMNDLKRG